MVRKGGFEPPRLAAPPPQDGASASSATSASSGGMQYYSRAAHPAGQKERQASFCPASAASRRAFETWVRRLLLRANPRGGIRILGLVSSHDGCNLPEPGLVVTGAYMPQRELRFTDDLLAAATEIAGLGGKISHRFTSRVFVAEFPDGTDTNNLKASSSEPPAGLDRESSLAAAAWIAARDEMPLAADPTDRLKWDTPGYQAPDLPPDPTQKKKARPLGPPLLLPACI